MWGINFYLGRPEYLELNVAPPNGKEWYYTQKSVQTWEDNDSTFFIWRREMTLFHSCCDSGTDWEWKSILTYFDNWFFERGWERAESQGGLPCNIYMPESRFLKIGPDGYVWYKLKENQIHNLTPTACLAVWPLDDETTADFNIVLITANPSGWTVFFDQID